MMTVMIEQCLSGPGRLFHAAAATAACTNVLRYQGTSHHSRDGTDVFTTGNL